MKRVLTAFAILIALLFFIFLFDAWMLLYKPVAQYHARLSDEEVTELVGRIEGISDETGSRFYDKELSKPPARNGEISHEFRQFGFCNVRNCLTVSNNFGQSEYLLFIYDNTVVGGGFTELSDLEDDRLDELFAEVEELGSGA